MDINNPFSKQKLTELKILLKRLGINIPDERLYDAAVSIAGFVCVTELHDYRKNHQIGEV